jgi:hypothetical protein
MRGELGYPNEQQNGGFGRMVNVSGVWKNDMGRSGEQQITRRSQKDTE